MRALVHSVKNEITMLKVSSTIIVTRGGVNGITLMKAISESNIEHTKHDRLHIIITLGWYVARCSFARNVYPAFLTKNTFLRTPSTYTRERTCVRNNCKHAILTSLELGTLLA